MDYQHLWNNGEVILDSPVDKEEPFVEIRIITLKAYLESKAIDLALEEGADLSNIDQRVRELLCTKMTNSREFIYVTADYIQVGVDVDLIDDVVISNVWELLSSYEDLTPGTTIKLGPLVHVYEKENSSLNKRAN